MYVVYTLRGLARWFGDLQSVFERMSSAISSIWLIGPNLSHWFYDVADALGRVEVAALDLADDFYTFYLWVQDNLRPDGITGALLYYADDLLNFIQNPWEWIGDIVRIQIASLRDMQDDPGGFVIRAILENTGLDMAWLHDPYGTVGEIFYNSLGELREVLESPYTWVDRQLSNLIPGYRTLIDDPRRWIKRYLPDLPSLPEGLLSDPAGYVLDHVMQGLETRLDGYRDRLVNLAGRILEQIF